MSEALTQGALDSAADDLPRTLRREREARYREAMQKAQRERDDNSELDGPGIAAALAPEPRFVVPDPITLAGEAQPAMVTAIRMPFLQLVAFFLKAVLAAIPALILLGVILWGLGTLLQLVFPSLVKMRIFIDFPR